jgi:hypothetical protein
VEATLGKAVIPDPVRRKLWVVLGVVLAAAFLCAGFVAVGGHRGGVGRVSGRPTASGLQLPAAPGLRGVRVHVTPPAYTGRASREQEGFALRVEEGAIVGWELFTDAAVDTVEFIFNDSSRVGLRPEDTSHAVWLLTEKIMRSGFYQVRVGNRLSALFQLEVQADEPPSVVIQTPGPYTVVDYGDATQIRLQVLIKDDYGITDAAIETTVSSGSGEAVKFRQRELRWGEEFTGDRAAYSLMKVLDLGALGLKPGDELYFFCRARDSRGQEGRTETYIISLADTAQLMSLEGIVMPVDVKPEFFRSERQIIIETEQLLKARDTMPGAAFAAKSNDLGLDQKLLRLRYGKFLGEEAEEGWQGPAGGPADTIDYGPFGDATKILDVFTDKHDNAEDATYFEPGIKRQLRATLSEMWQAELKLRTVRPGDALHFEYKALRLLKDLQQQSRAFVAKTGMKVAPLNPAKRLTGELGAIRAPVQEAGIWNGVIPSEEDLLRMALAIPGTGGIGSGDRVVLERVSQRLGREAASRPAVYLGAYEELKKVLTGGGGDMMVIKRAIQRLLPVAVATPSAETGPVDGGLGKLYFRDIER